MLDLVLAISLWCGSPTFDLTEKDTHRHQCRKRIWKCVDKVRKNPIIPNCSKDGTLCFPYDHDMDRCFRE